jgi:hypothetical protein
MEKRGVEVTHDRMGGGEDWICSIRPETEADWKPTLREAIDDLMKRESRKKQP